MKIKRLRRSRSLRRHFFAMLCGAALLQSSPRLCGAQEKPANPPQELSIEQYRVELDRCAGVVQRPADIPQFQNSLPPFWTVRIREKSVDVPTEAIQAQLQQLQGHAKDPEAAAREMRLLLNGMKREAEELARSGGNASPGKNQALLENILNRKEFRGAHGPSGSEILMAKLSRWLMEKIARLFSALHLGARTSNIIVWCVIVLAFLALGYMVLTWLSGRPLPVTPRPPASTAPSDARHWIQEAVTAAERGDYRTALHCAYWGAIARLEDLGRLSRDRARTPRESLRLLESQSGDHRLLHALTGIFERVWYGYRAASEADWAGARELLEKIGCLEPSTAPTANS